MKRQQRIRIVADRLYDEARRARTALCRLLYPMPNAATDSAFVIEQEDRRGLFLNLWHLAHFMTRMVASPLS